MFNLDQANRREIETEVGCRDNLIEQIFKRMEVKERILGE